MGDVKGALALAGVLVGLLMVVGGAWVLLGLGMALMTSGAILAAACLLMIGVGGDGA